LEYFIRDDRLEVEDKKPAWQKHINCTFAFSMIWGFGASYGSAAHRYLDTIFRDFFGKLQIPPKETVFQYYYHEKEMRWKTWEDLLGGF
jgi:hypothetical protein